MKIDVYTATGTKNGSLELPASLFEAKINKGLMHLALVRQQSNRRHAIAHVKHRGEVVGSTKKLFQQKGTGRARRGPGRSPLLNGGGKAFGPRNEANFQKDMPKKMRRAALFSCLSLRAKEGAIIGLESYPDSIKTKTFMSLLKKLPVAIGRRIVFVLPSRHQGLELSARNVERVRTIHAAYLNPEDILGAQHVVFLVDAIAAAEKLFTGKSDVTAKKVAKAAVIDAEPKAPKKVAKPKAPSKKPVVKKAPAAKKATPKK